MIRELAIPLAAGLIGVALIVYVIVATDEARSTRRSEQLKRDMVELRLSDGTVCVELYGKVSCGCAKRD